MASNLSEIRAALEESVANISGIPAAAQRAWDNVRFEPTVGTTWVKMTLIPLNDRPATRGDTPQYRTDGFFQISIFTPEGQGAGEAEALAETISDSYTVSDVLTKNSTSVRFEFAEIGQGMTESPWYMVPVTIRWYSYRN